MSDMPKKLRYVFINDVSEHGRHRGLIREFLNTGYKGGYRVVDASALRDRVFRHLEDYTKKHGKYRLIFNADTGGTAIFGSSKLREYGERITRLPYSSHMREMRWPTVLLRELPALGKNPKILLLEGDIGAIGSTAARIESVRNIIGQLRRDVRLRVVAGIANREKMKMAGVSYAASKTSAHPKRLSELVSDIERNLSKPAKGMPPEGASIIAKYKNKKGMKLLEDMKELRRYRGLHTGRLPH